MAQYFRLVRINSEPAIITIPSKYLDENDNVVMSKEWPLDVLFVNPTLLRQPHFTDGRYAFMLNKNTALDAILPAGESITKYVGANSNEYDPNCFKAASAEEFEKAVRSFFPASNGQTVPSVAIALTDTQYGAKEFMKFINDKESYDSEAFVQAHMNDENTDSISCAIATMLGGMYEDGGDE